MAPFHWTLNTVPAREGGHSAPSATRRDIEKPASRATQYNELWHVVIIRGPESVPGRLASRIKLTLRPSGSHGDVVVTPCAVVGRYKRFGCTYCFHLQGECDTDSMFFRNAGNQGKEISQLRTPQSEFCCFNECENQSYPCLWRL